ncbi:MAG: error-prone DNA polymerase [Microthrixaceae bacterium]|nr:error-prone DNA polymerase [Microthrixaceae bacterium]
MGFSNPGIPWSEMERRLSDQWDLVDPMASGHRNRSSSRPPGDGGDSPAWSQHRDVYEAPEGLLEELAHRVVAATKPDQPKVPYAELHCHSAFSFLDGASYPEALMEEAARLGIDALAITDHHGLYGAVRFAEASRVLGVPSIFGTEITLNGTTARNGCEDPDGKHLVVLAKNPRGYAQLSALLSEAQMAGEKGRPQLSFATVAEAASGGARGNWAVLTGCRKGLVPAALTDEKGGEASDKGGARAAERNLRALTAAFGTDNTFVELWDHGDPTDGERNEVLLRVARLCGTKVVATNNVHYAKPSDRLLASALSAIRAGCAMEQIDSWIAAAGSAHLRSGYEQQQRFARFPGAVATAYELGLDCSFDLALVAPNLPPYPCPDYPEGHHHAGRAMNEMEYLRHLAHQGAVKRYGPRHAERIGGAWRQIDHELDLIESLGFPGYFLVVWDIVEFCHRSDIYCQGRGSAANSAVCFALGITKADAVRLGLLFERFMSPERDGPPDIDLDIESGRREEVIQYVYERYGRSHAAQVANVITYRARSAVRDASRALGFSAGQQDAWAKRVDRWSGIPDPDESQIPYPVTDLAGRLLGLPRHLGIHSGGMVMCDRPVIEVCPTEWARMEGRSVLQWDKDDCASAGLVKFDLLGLGMLTALHKAVDLIFEHHGVQVDLAEIPQEDEVYDMLCQADSIGVFQVESRAQMATLPRLRPRCFYDLVVEVALIRPGPIQGGSVHPYIRRRKGQEPVTYLHPLLEKSLAKTLGVPLFQEQLMQMVIDVADFTPGDADKLRQAMGSKRSERRMEKLHERFVQGTAANGIEPGIADQIWAKLAAFANYGFPESHSVSFAYLVYASAWIKCHYPAAFCAALLNSQPMGFYSPQSLVQDARRHGVTVHKPDVNFSDWCATLEPLPDGTTSVRLGISSVRSIGEEPAKRIAEGRPYESVEDLFRRCDLDRRILESLATADAFASIGSVTGDRRGDLWLAGAVARNRSDQLPGMVLGGDVPQLPGMSDWEEMVADLWATGISPAGHPIEFLRADLSRRGAVRSVDLRTMDDGSKVVIAGLVTHRQRPATAAGITFVNLEDETGFTNVVVSGGAWKRYRSVLVAEPALLVTGRLERNEDDVINVVLERVWGMPVVVPSRSRDFR